VVSGKLVKIVENNYINVVIYINISLRVSVRMKQLGSRWMDLLKSVDIIKFCSKLDKHIRHFRRRHNEHIAMVLKPRPSDYYCHSSSLMILKSYSLNLWRISDLLWSEELFCVEFISSFAVFFYDQKWNVYGLKPISATSLSRAHWFSNKNNRILI
jgi:hypothetical protein